MNITILCVGKLKEKYWVSAAAEYGKRLSRYCNLKTEELKEEKIQDNPSLAEIAAVKRAEAGRMCKTIRSDDYVIALDLHGKELTSVQFAEKISKLGLSGKSNIIMAIGGSFGLGEELLKRADLKLSFSQMTYPHQLMRIILLEQIYRGFKIIKNEKYHK